MSPVEPVQAADVRKMAKSNKVTMERMYHFFNGERLMAYVVTFTPFNDDGI